MKQQMAQELSQDGMLGMDTEEVRSFLGPGYEEAQFPPGTVGRSRLVQALASRLGSGFKTSEQARRFLKDHDQATSMARTYVRLRKESMYGRR